MCVRVRVCVCCDTEAESDQQLCYTLQPRLLSITPALSLSLSPPSHLCLSLSHHQRSLLTLLLLLNHPHLFPPLSLSLSSIFLTLSKSIFPPRSVPNLLLQNTHRNGNLQIHYCLVKMKTFIFISDHLLDLKDDSASSQLWSFVSSFLSVIIILYSPN